MSETPVYNPPRHLPYLDAARGIAALMVLFCHFYEWKYVDKTGIKILGILFNGHDAVSFFFVLSGMVLTYQYVVLNNTLDLRKYYISRFFRLFPAFFIAVLMNALYWWKYELTPAGLYRELILNHTHFWEEAILLKPHVQFFIAGWTLTIELAASFFIPYLIVIGKVNRKLLWWMILASLIVLRITDMFIFHFTLGAIISFYYQELQSEELKQKKWYKYRYLIMAVAVVFFSIRKIDRIIPFGERFYKLGEYLQINFFHYTGIASFIFIIWMMRNKRVQRFLSTKPLQFLGKISYGIYLMHWLFVGAIYDHWDYFLSLFPNKIVTLFVMSAVCLIITLILATILHYTVELPFIRLSKKLTSKLKPSIIIGEKVAPQA